MKKQKTTWKNKAKNLLLLVLAVLLLVLTLVNWINDLSLDTVPTDSWLGRLYIDLSYGASGGFELRSGEIPAASPVECAVAREGALVGAQYNEVTVKSFLSAYGGTVAAALGGVHKLEAGEETAFLQALASPALYLRYDSSLPLSLINNWMGGSAYTGAQDLTVTMLLLTQDGQLWVRDIDGMLFCAETDVDAGAAVDRNQTFTGYACRFAAAAGTPYFNAAVHPETLLFSETIALANLTCGPAQFDIESAASLQQLLQAFGYEPYVSNYDDENTGKRVFVENQSTLRVGEDGTVLFRANTVEGGLEAYLESELRGENRLTYQIDYTRLLLETVAQSFTSDASFYFVRAEQDETADVTRLLFRYAVGGVPIMGEEGVMAVAEFRDNMLLSAELNLNIFKQSQTTAYLLPSEQAASAASDTPCSLRVGYFPEADGGFRPNRYYLTDGKGT